MTSPKLQSISANWVLPVSSDPIKDGAVVFDSGSVIFAGTTLKARGLFPDAENVHYHGKAVLPGLVNTHCHLAHSFLKNQIFLGKEETFFDWIEKVISIKTVTPEEKQVEAARQGLTELKKSGALAVGDITTAPFTIPMLEDSEIQTVFFHEVTGFIPEEADKIYDKTMEKLEGLESGSGSSHYISPHSPYSVSRELLGKIARKGGRVSYHLAESRDEVDFLKKGHQGMENILKSLGKWNPAWKAPGVSPVRYFYETGLLHEDAIATHMIWVDREDYPILEKTRPHICLCPRSNARLKNGAPPVMDYLGLGLNLCLGTDGLGSNDGLSILDEMRCLKKRFPGLEDRLIVKMGTLGGAMALGLEEKLGTIGPGKINRFTMVDCEGDDPYSFLN